MKLTKDLLIKEAELFCARANSREHPELLGINDGKTIGTYIEHEFKKYLKSKYEFSINFLKSEIERCKVLGVKTIVLHPGSSVGIDESIASELAAHDAEIPCHGRKALCARGGTGI